MNSEPVLFYKIGGIRYCLGIKMAELVKLKFFNSIVEAELAKNVLKENGVKCMVVKRGMQFPGDLGDSFGADLFVTKENLEKAGEIINFL